MTGQIVGKSDFARLTKVTPGPVSQWIKAGRIGGPALQGSGRAQRIVVATAIEQLRGQLNRVNTRARLSPTADEISERVASALTDQRLRPAQVADREARGLLKHAPRQT